MTRTNARGESWEEFVARKRREDRETEYEDGLEIRGGGGLPEDWEDRPRKRAERHPPNFDAEREHALAWAEIHGHMWAPEVTDLKRVEEGGTALLLRDRKGTRLMVVVRGGTVLACGTEEEFREREEVLE